MTSVDRVKEICKERGIAISKLESELGFSNGYVRSIKKGVFPADRLRKIAEYLDVTTDFLLDGSNGERSVSQQFTSEFAFTGYLRAIGWNVSYIDMAKDMPCKKCDEMNRNVPRTAESPFGESVRLCQKCVRKDNHFRFENGTVSFNVSPDEYLSLEKEAHSLCVSWIKKKIYESLSESEMLTAAHDNGSTLDEIAADKETFTREKGRKSDA